MNGFKICEIWESSNSTKIHFSFPVLIKMIVNKQAVEHVLSNIENNTIENIYKMLRELEEPYDFNYVFHHENISDQLRIELDVFDTVESVEIKRRTVELERKNGALERKNGALERKKEEIKREILEVKREIVGINRGTGELMKQHIMSRMFEILRCVGAPS